MLRAAAALPEMYREPLFLQARGLTCGQIGRAMDLPSRTVETRLARARRMLREALSGGEIAGRPAAADSGLDPREEPAP